LGAEADERSLSVEAAGLGHPQRFVKSRAERRHLEREGVGGKLIGVMGQGRDPLGRVGRAQPLRHLGKKLEKGEAGFIGDDPGMCVRAGEFPAEGLDDGGPLAHGHGHTLLSAGAKRVVRFVHGAQVGEVDALSVVQVTHHID